jgi:hypothetical protein
MPGCGRKVVPRAFGTWSKRQVWIVIDGSTSMGRQGTESLSWKYGADSGSRCRTLASPVSGGLK